VRWKALLGVALALLLGVGVAGVATARNDHDKRAQRLTLWAEETAFTWVTATGEVFTGPDEEEPPSDPRPGDRFISVETLYSDQERSTEVGRNDIACDVTEVRGEFPQEEPPPDAELDFFLRILCRGVVSLHGQGDIAWQGATEFSDEAFEQDPTTTPLITVALTGGTGVFNRAGGEARIFDFEGEDGDDAALSRYELILYTLRAEHPPKK
jgi:hypothetical protein